MGKLQKSKSDKPKARGPRRPEKELLKKPHGMCGKVFKEIAWILAIDLKTKMNKASEDKVEYKKRK